MVNKLFTLGGLPVEEQTQEVKEAKRLPLNIQFFADKDEQPDEPDEPDEGEFDVDAVLEKPEVEERIQKRFKEQLGKRLKGKDKEIERLKAELEGKTEKPDDKGEKDPQKPEVPDKVRELVETSERKLKVAAVKTFAADAEIDAFLFRKFVDLKDVELDEDGDPVNLDDILEELRDDARTAKYFAVTDDEESDEEDEPANKQYRPGTKQKMNKKKKVDPAELGRQKALARHQKKED